MKVFTLDRNVKMIHPTDKTLRGTSIFNQAYMTAGGPDVSLSGLIWSSLYIRVHFFCLLMYCFIGGMFP